MRCTGLHNSSKHAVQSDSTPTPATMESKQCAPAAKLAAPSDSDTTTASTTTQQPIKFCSSSQSELRAFSSVVFPSSRQKTLRTYLLATSL
mmetsp:Transcript_11668/g.43867  ORF Transcript_11668/g.43867 Transcript_11668/m.43867 type:complete len:91 (+) Transcript_11668:1431-1703(+)